MVALFLYAYARGNLSSRWIERGCREDVAFKVITTLRVPDHSTIAEFRRRHERALAGAFSQVLALCAEAGLVSAVDRGRRHQGVGQRLQGHNHWIAADTG